MLKLEENRQYIAQPFYAKSGTVGLFGDVDCCLDWQATVMQIHSQVSTLTSIPVTIFVSLSNYHDLVVQHWNSLIKHSPDKRFKFHFTIPNLVASSMDSQSKFWDLTDVNVDHEVYRRGVLRPSFAQKFLHPNTVLKLEHTGYYCYHYVYDGNGFKEVDLSQCETELFSQFYAKQAVFAEQVRPQIDLVGSDIVIQTADTDKVAVIGHVAE